MEKFKKEHSTKLFISVHYLTISIGKYLFSVLFSKLVTPLLFLVILHSLFNCAVIWLYKKSIPSEKNKC